MGKRSGGISLRRAVRVIVAALLVGSFIVVHETDPPKAVATPEITPFSCSPFLYQFVSGTFYELNATNGNYEDYGARGSAPHTGLGSINALGYNPADDFMYGVSGGRLYRVGTNDYEEVTTDATRSAINGVFAGDFIDDNVLLVGPDSRGWHTIRVDTSPATISPYTVNGAFPAADFTVDADGDYAYGMASDKLYRIDLGPSSGTVANISIGAHLNGAITAAKSSGVVGSTYARNTGGGWGSAYSTSTGELLFFRNVDGSSGAEVWKLEFTGDPFSGGSVSAELMAAGQDLEGGNDGASCPNAPSPFTTPETVDDSYAFSTGDTFTSPSGGGLLEGDTASSSGLVLYKVSFDRTFPTFPDGSTLYRLPNSSSDLQSSSAVSATNTTAQSTLASGGVTLEITDWDDGAFSLSGLSGAGGTTTFYYTGIEQSLQISQTVRRETSNYGTVTIATLSVDANAGGTGNVVLSDATQYVDYSPGHTFAATSGISGSVFWHAEFIQQGSGDTLPSAPVNTTSLPTGLSLNSSTGVLSGVPVGDELSSGTTYTLRIFAALDDQFKTFASRDFTLTIHAPTDYTLSYNSNSAHDPDERQSGSPPSSQTAARLTISAASALSDPCFAFRAWDTQADDSGTEFAPGDRITFTDDTLPVSDPTEALPAQNTTLFAQWTDTRVNLTYNGNSADGGSVPTDSTDYCDGDSVSLAANPNALTRSGFRLVGWDRNPSATSPESTLSSPGTLTASTSNITVYAVWSEEFSITFDGNSSTGGAVPTDGNTYIAGQTVTLPSNSGLLSRTGFDFGGWNTLPNGSGTTYAASGSATLSMPSGDLTLYARWLASSPPISGGGGGGSSGDPENRGTPAPVVTPEVITRERPIPRVRLTPEGPATSEIEVPESDRQGSLDNPVEATVPEPATSTPTYDSGLGLQRGASPLDSLLSSEEARRSLSEVSRERLAGFLPTAPITIEVRGARTGARFVTDAEILTNPPLLLEQVALASRSSVDTFFAIENLSLANSPTGLVGALPEDEARVFELFSSAGLEPPQTISQDQQDALGVEGWIRVNTTVREYKPGSVVYLIVNSEPLIVGYATVGEDGTAQVAGDIPIGWFGIGEHRIRAVGIKEFDGIQVDQDGELVIPNEVLGKIREFDLGTQATILASGPNPEGGSHLAIRVVPLEPDAPWWTLWIIGGAFALMLVARLRGVLATRAQGLIGAFAVVMAAAPGVALGWVSTVTIVAVWAAILGLAGAFAVALVSPRRSRPSGRAG